MRTICRYRFYISVIHFSRGLFFAGILAFDVIFKEKRLDSS